VNVLNQEEPRYHWSTTSFSSDINMITAAVQIATEGKRRFANVTAAALIVAFHPNLINQGLRNGGNFLGLNSTPQIWCSLSSGWWFAQDDDIVRSRNTQIMQQIEATSMSMGVYQRYLFMNDASEDQDVLAHYGERNLALMKRVSRTYDPMAMFQEQQPGGFKLG